MDFKSLIMNGKSVRDYKPVNVEASKLEEIESYISNSKKLVPSIDVEVRFFNGADAYKRLYGVAGYKGVMIEAPNYMVILSENKPNHIENAGYVGERAILKARDLGVDSCWVSYDDQEMVKKVLDIDSDKEVVCLIALGYANVTKKVESDYKVGDTYVDAKVGKVEMSSGRIAIEDMVFIDKWGNNATADVLEERALFDAFSYTRMAPSALNKQPWRFIVDGGKVLLLIDNENYDGSYINKIDAGIVMLYFGLILDITLFDSKWGFDEVKGDYNIPSNYKIVGYCNI